jgi:AcrR family transcriptional regulator
LNAVRETITEAGYGGLTMRALAKRAGVALQTLYNEAANKDELVLGAVYDLLQLRYEQARRRHPEPGHELILETVDQQAKQIEETPRYAEAVTIALLQSAPRDPLTRLLINGGRRIYRTSLEVLRDKGQLNPNTPIERTADLLVAADWAPMLIWQKGYLELSELRRTLRDQHLTVLISVTRGKVRRELESLLAADQP